MLRVLAGLCIPDEGDVIYPNNADDEPHLLYLASPPAKIPELSVFENCQFQALLHGGQNPASSMINHALMYWGVEHLADQPLSNLSQGQQQRVALAALLLGKAKLWLLDEPVTALDSVGTEAFWALCRQHQKQGGSIVMATHQEPKGDVTGIRRIQLEVPHTVAKLE